MAQLSLGECRWRMVRRVIRKKKFVFMDCRAMTRHDRGHFDWLVENGFFAALGKDEFEITDKGRAAADLGMYEWEPARPAVVEKNGAGRSR